ncbi:MAG TPA: HAMP domain-containing sensor histidine kinase [Gemmatimonadaceae bacterium]|nr:HAMP domain-containing sensor histidine kinase [Gemmatimonadaceae bacterium]
MTTPRPVSFNVDLGDWPGIVLRVGSSGEILASNGRLDALLGVGVAGRAISDLLDPDSSVAKWKRIAVDGSASKRTWELVFCTEDRVLETTAFSLVPAPDESERWLVEHPATPRLTQLAAEVSAVNAELATAQRRLIIEQGRLARALAEVERSNLALDEFAHVVSHDLKAPVRAIREYAGSLLDPGGSGTPDERAGDLLRIQQLATRMRRMIDAALEYARAGNAGDRVEAIDTTAVIRDVVEFLAPPPGVTIQVERPLPIIVTERAPFEQVFRNLLSNAITWRRPDGARVEVAARDEGDACEFTVADNGPGIPEGQEDRIWRLFHTSAPGEGSGLGLALVKRVVEAHHGTVAVRPTPGGGATFVVRWPKRPSGRIAPRVGEGGGAHD